MLHYHIPGNNTDDNMRLPIWPREREIRSQKLVSTILKKKGSMIKIKGTRQTEERGRAHRKWLARTFDRKQTKTKTSSQQRQTMQQQKISHHSSLFTGRERAERETEKRREGRERGEQKGRQRREGSREKVSKKIKGSEVYNREEREELRERCMGEEERHTIQACYCFHSSVHQ